MLIKAEELRELARRRRARAAQRLREAAGASSTDDALVEGAVLDALDHLAHARAYEKLAEQGVPSGAHIVDLMARAAARGRAKP